MLSPYMQAARMDIVPAALLAPHKLPCTAFLRATSHVAIADAAGLFLHAQHTRSSTQYMMLN